MLQTHNTIRQVVLVVARELGMSAGKVGAQCAHAAVGLYKQLLERRAPWLRPWEVPPLYLLLHAF